MNAYLTTAGSGLALLSLLSLSGCSGGAKGDPGNRGPFEVALVSTGLGQVYPYRIRQADGFGNPTSTVLNIDSIDVLKANLTPNNPVLPVSNLGTSALLPSGAPGNQFLLLRFSHNLQIESILSDLLANQTNSGLTTAVSLLQYNPVTEQTQVVMGRGFVGGYTYFNRGGQLELVKAVEEQNGAVVVLDAEATGFPAGFSGDVDLVSPKSFVFVADNDANLSTFDIFPSSELIRIIVSSAVRDSDNKILEAEVCTTTTVGPDPNPPDVLGAVSGGTLAINPGNGATDVDPSSTLLVRFNKPVQPGDMGAFFDATNLVPATGGVTLAVSSGASTFNVIYYADPVSFGDFCNYTITPAYILPGSPPPPATPTSVAVTVNRLNVRGLSAPALGATVSTNYSTGTGPGLINAPVAPEAIYVGIGGPTPGLSVIDLNGFGQGTGDMATTRFTLNPNVGAPGVDPPLSPGTSSLDAGSSGVFTLTQDTAGNTRLLSDPLVGQIGDIHIGAPLDVVFNNENLNRNTSRSNQTNALTTMTEAGNNISVAPHPNPPRLRFPPPNPARAIFSEEPTKTTTRQLTGAGGAAVQVSSPPCQNSPINLLGVGNPFGTTKDTVGVLRRPFTNVFNGPQPVPGSPPPPTPYCPFTSRQQVGHFLYVLDRDNRQVLVVNSNRMTVLDTIRLNDPYDMAMAPNLRTLAVTNFSSSSVSFIDINPFSETFNQIIGETRVEAGPTAIAWQPDGEIVIAVSTTSNSATLMSGIDFSVIRTVSGFLSQPVDVVLTQRYQTTGNTSGVFFGYILNANGTVAVFESGPDGVNGIGFNDIIGTVPDVEFRRPRKLLLDPSSDIGAVFVAHLDEANVGQVSRLELTSSPRGPLAINQFQGGIIIPPTFRQKTWTVIQRFGGQSSTTSGVGFSGNTIIDIALDEVFNAGSTVGQSTPYNFSVPPTPFGHSGKSFVRNLLAPFNTPQPYIPQYLFAAIADRGVVDVLELASGRRIASISVEGIPRVLGQYWRQ